MMRLARVRTCTFYVPVTRRRLQPLLAILTARARDTPTAVESASLLYCQQNLSATSRKYVAPVVLDWPKLNNLKAFVAVLRRRGPQYSRMLDLRLAIFLFELLQSPASSKPLSSTQYNKKVASQHQSLRRCVLPVGSTATAAGAATATAACHVLGPCSNTCCSCCP